MNRSKLVCHGAIGCRARVEKIPVEQRKWAVMKRIEDHAGKVIEKQKQTARKNGNLQTLQACRFPENIRASLGGLDVNLTRRILELKILN